MEIPIGWRKLEVGEAIKPGDKWWNQIAERFHETTMPGSTQPGVRYIRKLSPVSVASEAQPAAGGSASGSGSASSLAVELQKSPEAAAHGAIEALPVTSSRSAPVERSSSVVDLRIYTRCPACHNDTLIINNGRLLCTWYQCPDPTLIDKIGEPQEPKLDDSGPAEGQKATSSFDGAAGERATEPNV